MVKGISSINGFVKAGVVAAMLAGSTALYATNPKTKNTQPNQTEVVSKAGAEALKSANLQNIQQAQVPTVNNPRLDNTFRKFAQNVQQQNVINGVLKSIYKQNGTFLGSVIVQHEIDRQQLGAFADCNVDILINNNINPKLGKEIKGYGPDFFKSVQPKADKVTKWLQEEYTPAIYSLLKFDKIPGADEVIEKLDYIAEKKTNFNMDEMIEYYTYSDGYKRNTLNNRTDVQAKSDLAAFKMFLIDKIIMRNSVKNCGIYGKDSFYLADKRIGLDTFFEKWMESVRPIAEIK